MAAFMEVDQPNSDLERGRAPASEHPVREGLRLLERESRRLALFALADWQSLDIPAPTLFTAVSALQRPSWGAWNGLVLQLQRAQSAALQETDASQRERIEATVTLFPLLRALDRRLTSSEVELVRPLAKLARVDVGKRPRLRHVLPAPIVIRNRIAHDAPTGAAWWDEVAAALRSYLQFHAEVGLVDACCPSDRSTPPWVLDEGGQTWMFNGFARDSSGIYVADDGSAKHDPAAGASVLHRFAGILGKTAVQERDLRKLLARWASDDILGVMLGDFLVGPPVGEGGFAKVHVARQLSTGRKVAVKILRDGISEEARERFVQEAAFLARFDHPNIVSVIAAGEDTWVPPSGISLSDEPWFRELSRGSRVRSYIALEWIDGQTLDEVFRSSDNKPSVEMITTWFRAAADALAAVHATGLIHRDIKPGNLMVATDGEIKLMDFGIARTQLDSRTLMTREGVLGTPGFMSPEQLRAADQDTDVGASTDVYSLCATFYELFTRHFLYEHDQRPAADVRRDKLNGVAPKRPRTLDAKIPREIESLILGGLRTEVADRPKSMSALADDLRQVLTNEPIRYQRPALWRRVQLGYRRNRRAVWATAIVATVFLLGAGVAVWRIDGERAIAEANETRAIEQAGRARATLALGAATEYADADPTLAALFLREGTSNQRLRGWGDVLSRVVFPPVASLVLDGADPILDLRVGADGRHIFAATGRTTASGRGCALVWDLEDPSAPRCLGEGESHARVDVSADGRWLVSARAYGDSVNVFDLQRVGTVAEFVLEGDGLVAWRVSERGEVLTVGQGGLVRIWATDGATPVAEHKTDGEWSIEWADWSPEGDLVAFHTKEFRDNRGSLYLWRRGSEAKMLDLPFFVNASLAPNGKRLAYSSREIVEVINATDEVKTASFEFGPVGEYSWSEAGHRLALGTYESQLRVVRTTDGATLREVSWDGDGWIEALSLDPAGERVALSVSGQPVRVWSVDGVELPIELEHVDDVESLVWTHDGRHLWTGDKMGLVRRWAIDGGRPRYAPHHVVQYKSHDIEAAWSPDGDRLAFSGGDRLHVVATEQVISGANVPLIGASDDGLVSHMAWSPDGQRIATNHYQVGVKIWDAESQRLIHRLPQDGFVDALEWGANGHSLAVAVRASDNKSGTVDLWDLKDEAVRGRLLEGHWITALDFHSGAGALAAAGRDGLLFVWSSGGELTRMEDEGGIDGVVFDPQGRTVLVTRGADGIATRWSIAERTKLHTLESGFAGVADFDPVHGLLATGGSRGGRTWAADGAQAGFQLGGRMVTRAAWRPSGDAVVLVARNEVRISSDRGIHLRLPRVPLNNEDARFDPTGLHLLTTHQGNADAALLIWPHINEIIESPDDVLKQLVRSCLPVRLRVKHLGEERETAQGRYDACWEEYRNAD